MELNIEQIDIDKYLNWFYQQKGTSFDEEKIKIEEVSKRIIDRIKSNIEYSEEEKKELIRNEIESRQVIIDSYKNTTFWKAPTENERKAIDWEINHTYKYMMDLLTLKLESSAIDEKIIISNEINYHLKEIQKTLNDVHHAVINGYLTSNFIGLGCYVGGIKFAKDAQKMIEDLEEIEHAEKPLRWMGKTANLGYIMGLLADNGYIDAPKKRDGEINYNEFARRLGKIFEFDGNNISTLSKALNIDSNNMEYKNKDLFRIPHIKEIS